VNATALLVWGALAHLIVDWLFQNAWLAEHKSSLRHPAAYVHAAAHALGLVLVFPPLAALGLGATHLLIDTRRPLAWWARLISQTDDGPIAVPIRIWRDQTLHLATIGAAALLVTHVF
jgi:hypothetical protein